MRSVARDRREIVTLGEQDDEEVACFAEQEEEELSRSVARDCREIVALGEQSEEELVSSAGQDDEELLRSFQRREGESPNLDRQDEGELPGFTEQDEGELVRSNERDDLEIASLDGQDEGGLVRIGEWGLGAADRQEHGELAGPGENLDCFGEQDVRGHVCPSKKVSRDPGFSAPLTCGSAASPESKQSGPQETLCAASGLVCCNHWLAGSFSCMGVSSSVHFILSSIPLLPRRALDDRRPAQAFIPSRIRPVRPRRQRKCAVAS